MVAPLGRGEASRRPAHRVTDIFRQHGEAFQRGHVLTPVQHKVVRALATCRTAALGGHVEVCDHCDFLRPCYNSCRNRHCPGCQAAAAHQWLAQRLERVLPTHHFHVVFTLPEELRAITLRNGAVVYDILLRAAANVLDTLGRQRLGAQVGVTSVLHTWTRAMLYHPHVHCVVTGGGLAHDGPSWVATPPTFLFPVAVMRKLFRGIVRRRLRADYDASDLDLGGDCAPLVDPKVFARLLRSIHVKRWVVYSKPPFAGPDEVFAYLGRYTHRVAISDHRILSVDDDAITFRTKFGQQATVAPFEFMRRFLLHVLPAGFHKIRHTGVYAASNVHTRLATARNLLGCAQLEASTPRDDVAEREPECRNCPVCGVGFLLRLAVPKETFVPAPRPATLDTS